MIQKSGEGGGTYDVGSNANQIPTNAIAADKVQAKLDTYNILTKVFGNLDVNIPDIAKVKALIAAVTDPITGQVSSHTTSINNIIDVLLVDLENQIAALGAPGFTATTEENLEDGMYIHVFRSGNVAKCIRANATTGHLANGYVLSDYLLGAEVTYFRTGDNTKGNDLPAGKIWLSGTTPGLAASAPPAMRSGKYLQELGASIGLNKHLVEFGSGIQLL